MFDHFVLSVLVAPSLVVFATWFLVDRSRPDLAARAFSWVLTGVAWASAVNLLAFALKALAEIPVVATWGGWSHQVVANDTAHVPWVPWISLVWLVLGILAALRARRRSHRALTVLREDIDWGEPEGGNVTIIPDDRPDAFTLPGETGHPHRIVVTTGLRDVLDDTQYRAVLAHERAHLEGNHHRLVWRTRLASTLHPVLFPIVRHVEYLVERAADEAAAREVGDRDRVGRAVGHAALMSAAARRAAEGSQPPREALTILGNAPGVVPRRVAALLAPARRDRWALAVPLLFAAASIVWTGECVYDLFELLAAAAV